MVEQNDHWLLLGKYGTGKSTFASQMSPEYLVLDFDGRWTEQTGHVRGKYHIISDSDILKANAEMKRRNPDLKGKVQTVVVDSLSSILDYENAAGRIAVARGSGNMNDVHRQKADIMRVLRGSVLTFHCSALWVAHIEDGSLSGKAKTRITIPNTEVERMKSNLNCIVTMGAQGGRRYLKIEWCRYNNGAAVGQVIWDTNLWEGVPERLSVFLRHFSGTEGYKGLAYDLPWLQTFLAGKGKEYASLDEMREKLGIETVPLWFDRNAWGELIKRAGV